MTNPEVQAVENAVEQALPDSPVVQVAEAVAATVADPSPLNIMNDLQLALNLAKKLKAKLAGMHPSVTDIIKALF